MGRRNLLDRRLYEAYAYNRLMQVFQKRLMLELPNGQYKAAGALDVNYQYTPKNQMQEEIWSAPTGSNQTAVNDYTTTFDLMARPTTVHDNVANHDMVNNVGYTVANQLSQANYWSPTTSTYINETRTYNNLLQLTEVKDLNGSTSVMDMLYMFPVASANNGQITKQKDVVTGEEVSVTYDSLSRMITAANARYQLGAELRLRWTWESFVPDSDQGRLLQETKACAGSLHRPASTQHPVAQHPNIVEGIDVDILSASQCLCIERQR
jgi:hypothetical protein